MQALETKNSINNNVFVDRNNDKLTPKSKFFEQHEKNESKLSNSNNNNSKLNKGTNLFRGEVLNKYLLLIARLENGIINQNISKIEINEIVDNLVERLNELEEKQINFLKKTEEFQRIKEYSPSLKTNILDNLVSDSDRKNIFNWLKSKAFISLIKGEPLTDLVYAKRQANNSNNTPLTKGSPTTQHNNYALLNSGYNINQQLILG